MCIRDSQNLDHARGRVHGLGAAVGAEREAADLVGDAARLAARATGDDPGLGPRPLAAGERADNAVSPVG